MTFSQKSDADTAFFLVDNGSLRSASTLGLRRVANNLSILTGLEVQPVSVLHSHKVAPSELAGRPAEIFAQAVKRQLAAGTKRVVVLPLFFGPSKALTEYLPQTFSELARESPDARLVVADALGGNADEPDTRLAIALQERVMEQVTRYGLYDAPVILVDHGSPVQAVADLRNRVGKRLRNALKPAGHTVAVSSMERRPGPEYAFNEPLLEHLLGTPGFAEGAVIIAQLFLLEGRHAGSEGDIADICQAAESNYPGLHCYRTELLGEHPLIAEILRDRLRSVLN